MRIADVDFVLVPEWLADAPRKPTDHKRGHDDDHWISRWQRNFATAEWLDTQNGAPADALVAQTAAAERPTIIVTHGRGVDVLLGASETLTAPSIVGAFVVAPAPKEVSPPLPLRFASVIVAAEDHPELPTSEAQQLAKHLGGHFVSAGEAGRIDSASGQGPWPEGLMRLGWFLKQLRVH